MSDTYQGVEESAVEDDLAGQLSKAWDDAEAAESGIAPSPPPPEAPVDGRNRDEFGRFAPVAPEQQPQVEQPQQQYQPPTSWSPTAKQEWARLSPQMQEAIWNREQEMARGQEMYQGLRQWVEHAQQNGTSLPQVLNDYYNVHQQLASNFVPAIADLCRYFGYDPVQVAQYALGQMGGVGPDPTLQYLQNMRQEINSLKSQHEQQRDQAINSQLEEFAQTHEWYHNLEPMMVDVINHYRAMGQEIDLQGAYDAAAWAHPETRQILLDHYASQNQSNGQAAPKPSSNRGRSLQPGSPIPGATSQRKAKDSVFDELMANWDELSG